MVSNFVRDLTDVVFTAMFLSDRFVLSDTELKAIDDPKTL